MTCNFRAKDLLDLRRSIVHAPISSEAIALIVKTIDDVRFAHQEATQCTCWAEAVKAAPPEFALIGLTTEAA